MSTVAVAQPWTRADDLAGNVGRHAEIVRRAESRLVVFPELSVTGYDFAAPSLDPSDARLDPLIDACAEMGATALAGAPVERPGDGGRSIAVLAIDGNGAEVVYHKMFLGAAEASSFVAGPAPTVIDVDGLRVGVAVCRDLGVADHAAATVALGIDLYAAGVLEHAVDSHVTPARVAAITEAHHIWVAVASFAGSSGEGYREAAGRSGVWRPDGSCAAIAGPEPGLVVSATVPS